MFTFMVSVTDEEAGSLLVPSDVDSTAVEKFCKSSTRVVGISWLVLSLVVIIPVAITVDCDAAVVSGGNALLFATSLIKLSVWPNVVFCSSPALVITVGTVDRVAWLSTAKCVAIATAGETLLVAAELVVWELVHKDES